MKIYDSYDEEPQEQYEGLSPSLYRQFYDLEMAGVAEDLAFYLAALTPGSTILELGCGSGRLSRLLAAAGHRLVGIDLSLPMLRTACSMGGDAQYVCMDMRRLAFTARFDAVIIPYNTLNLLADNRDVALCLQGCRDHLNLGGKLLAQLYLPQHSATADKPGPTFQFQIFDRRQGGKVIKETLRTIVPDQQAICLEERYKVRPMNGIEPNRNFKHRLIINGNSRTAWLALLEKAGFAVNHCTNRYQQDSPALDSMLLLIAST